ncbi:MAG: hypothetical protein WDZ85_02655 [Candidatus Paceibacterota bacterium]
MFQDFFIKKMLKRQGVPDGQVDQLMGMIKKNPELFKKIAAEIQAKIKGGMGQQEAAMAVMKDHQAELRKLAE